MPLGPNLGQFAHPLPPIERSQQTDRRSRDTRIDASQLQQRGEEVHVRDGARIASGGEAPWVVNREGHPQQRFVNRELVPEFMPYFTSIDPLVHRVNTLIQDPEKLAQTSKDLIGITQPLAQQNTADTVARIALDMVS